MELAEEFLLDAEFLEDRLDHEVDAVEALHVGAHLHAGERRVAILGGHLPAVDRLREEALSFGARTFEPFEGGVETQRLEPRPSRDDGDARSHRAAGAAHSDSFDAHFRP